VNGADGGGTSALDGVVGATGGEASALDGVVGAAAKDGGSALLLREVLRVEVP